MDPSTRRGEPEIIDMTDFQLLAHLITMAGTDPARAGALADALLDAHQSLKRVLALPGETLARFPGLGEKAAAFLHFLPALIRRYTAAGASTATPPRRLRPDDMTRLLEPFFQKQSTERICAFCMGEDLELLTAASLSQGSSTMVTCSVARVLRLALTHRAKSVMLAHNHPDGTPFFSKSDLLATGLVAFALSTVDVPLVDHLLLAGGKIISLRELFVSGKITDLPFLPPQGWLTRPGPLEQIRRGCR